MSTVIERAREWAKRCPVLPHESCACTACDGLRMARVVVALDEVIEGLRREHVGEWAYGEFESCIDGCRCGADAHNATLDRLRKMLDEATP